MSASAGSSISATSVIERWSSASSGSMSVLLRRLAIQNSQIHGARSHEELLRLVLPGVAVCRVLGAGSVWSGLVTGEAGRAGLLVDHSTDQLGQFIGRTNGEDAGPLVRGRVR